MSNAELCYVPVVTEGPWTHHQAEYGCHFHASIKVPASLSQLVIYLRSYESCWTWKYTYTAIGNIEAKIQKPCRKMFKMLVLCNPDALRTPSSCALRVWVQLVERRRGNGRCSVHQWAGGRSRPEDKGLRHQETPGTSAPTQPIGDPWWKVFRCLPAWELHTKNPLRTFRRTWTKKQTKTKALSNFFFVVIFCCQSLSH